MVFINLYHRVYQKVRLWQNMAEYSALRSPAGTDQLLFFMKDQNF